MPRHIRDVQVGIEMGIYDGHAAFMEHPITQTAINGLAFVATGGIEGLAAIPSGVKGIFSLLGKGGVRKGARVLSRGVGAAPRGFNKVLQSGGHTIKSSTYRTLGLTKQEARDAIHALKNANNMRPNEHYKIMGNDDIVNPHTKEIIDNLFNYVF